MRRPGLPGVEPLFAVAAPLGGHAPEADSRVERSLYERANSDNYDVVKIFCNENGKVTRRTSSTCHQIRPPRFFWLKNRDRAHWRDA